jgi:glycosyltransferase involved in cell wall biosynthesis
MKVHIVTEGTWIKKFWSDKIIEYNKTKIEYSLSYEPRNDVDINFYICYNVFLYKQNVPKNTLNIGYVTHIHNNDPVAHSKDLGWDFFGLKNMDLYIHQSLRSMNQFTKLGFPAEKSIHILSPVEVHKFYTTITLGIFQNGAVEGKGLFFLLDLLDKYDFKNFKFLLCGKGWEQLYQKMYAKDIRYEYFILTQDQYYNVQQRELYERLDYLFVPSLWEGGPVAPLEAMAAGVPIISSDVGFMPEFNVEYMFEAGNHEQLIKILKSIEEPILNRRKKVEQLTYTEFNNKLYALFKEIIQKRPNYVI